jgi:hypothetical protein
MATTQNATVAVKVGSVDSFADTIGLGCGSLPAGVTCHFSSVSVALAANSTQTVQLTIDTNDPLTGGTTAMHAGPTGRKPLTAALSFPWAVFFGCLLVRFRKRHGRVFTLSIAVISACASLLFTGCTTFTQSSAAPGTYVIQVNGTGIDSNLSHYQNVTLNITK